MILTNGLVMTEDFKLKQLDVRVEGKKIVDLAETIQQEDTVLDLNGAYLLPDFVDTHIHGAYWVRISDAAPKLNQITHFETTQGVTSIAITTAASAFEDILRQIDTAVQAAHTSHLGTQASHLGAIWSHLGTGAIWGRGDGAIWVVWGCTFFGTSW